MLNNVFSLEENNIGKTIKVLLRTETFLTQLRKIRQNIEDYAMNLLKKLPIEKVFTNESEEVFVAGWVQQVRNLGGLKFIQLQDRTGLVQIVLPKKKVTPEIFEIDYQEGDIIAVKGAVVENKSAPKGKEILPSEVSVLNKRAQEYPIAIGDKIETNIDKRLDYRFLDLRDRKVAQIFEIESAVAYAIQEYFMKNEFLQFFSPKIVGSATESGANVFEIGYFGKKAFLAQFHNKSFVKRKLG